MAKAEPIFSIDLANGKKLKFNTEADLRKWFDEERKQWSWLVGANLNLGPQVGELRTKFQNGFSNIANQIQEWIGSPEDQKNQRAQRLHQAIARFYSDDQTMLSEHPYAQISRRIASDLSPIAAQAAFAALLKVPTEPLNASGVRGVIEGILLYHAISTKSVGLVEQTIEKLLADANGRIETQAATQQKQEAAVEAALAKAKESFSQELQRVTREWAAIEERVTKETSAAIDSIQSTEKKYKNEMALRAPVQYWRDEATKHKTDAANLKSGLFKFVRWGGIGLFGVIGLIILVLFSHPVSKADPYPYLAFATGIALLTTVLFWTGRVMVRLYLSSRHLATDAEERVAMIQTFLALSADSKVEPTERALVLTPLFRSSADGIVKDEGAPDLSLAALLARLLDGRTGPK